MSEPQAQTVIVVDRDFQGLVEYLWDQIEDETSELWRHIGEVVERVAPDIRPFDRREAVDLILRPIARVIYDD